MKHIWRAIVIILVVGFVLTIVGFSLGANYHGFYLNKNGFNFNNREQFTTQQLDLENITDITIDVLSYDVRFVAANNYGYLIKGQQPDDIRCEFQDGKLVIIQSKELFQNNFFSFFNFGFQPSDYIEIYLPADAVLNTIDIKAVSGDLKVDKLNSDKVYLQLMSGDVRLGEFNGKYFMVKATSGNVKIENGNVDTIDLTLLSGDLSVTQLTCQQFIADMTSGNINVRGAIKGDIRIKALSGDIRLQLDGQQQDYNRNITVLSGDVYINRDKGGGRVDFNGPYNIDINATSGNVRIDFLP